MLTILNKLPRIETLPVEAKIIDKKARTTFFDFMPGNNQVDPKVWNKIRNYYKDDNGNPKPDEFDDKYSSSIFVIGGQEAIEKQETPDILNLKDKDAIDLVEGSTNIHELNTFKSEESKRKPPRKSVLNAIDGQIKTIEVIRSKNKK